MTLSQPGRRSLLALKRSFALGRRQSKRRRWPARCNSRSLPRLQGPQGFTCRDTRPPIRFPDRVERHVRWLMPFEHHFDHGRNVDEAQVTDKKRSDSLVVCCTQNCRVRPPGDPRVSRETQGGKPFRVWRLEVETSNLSQVKQMRRQLHSLRVRQSVLNWHPHVGQAKLSHLRTINEFDKRVNHAFGVDKHLNSFIGQAEEP